MLKAAIIGFGGIAQAHKKGYDLLENEGKVKLVAACDIRKEAFEKQIEINLKSDTPATANTFHQYTDLDEMLANESIDFIDICVPTYLHAELAIKMLNKGYHVLSEKPMALSSEVCDTMLEAEKESGKHFMIAQCLRFFPEYEYLKTCIEENKYGKRSVEVVYLLRHKLKCGYCGQPISAESGTSKNGQVKRYYKCFGRKNHNGCKLSARFFSRRDFRLHNDEKKAQSESSLRRYALGRYA